VREPGAMMVWVQLYPNFQQSGNQWFPNFQQSQQPCSAR